MNISALIKILWEIRAEEGDLEVKMDDHEVVNIQIVIEHNEEFVRLLSE